MWLDCEKLPSIKYKHTQGINTASERKRLLQRQQNKIEQHLKTLQNSLEAVKFKIELYEEMEALGEDIFDINSKFTTKNFQNSRVNAKFSTPFLQKQLTKTA